MIRILERAEQFSSRTALIDDAGAHTYAKVSAASKQWAAALLNGKADLNEARVGIMMAPGFSFVAAMWGVWQAGGVAVPLCVDHPEPALRYTLTDAGCSLAIVDQQYKSTLAPITEQLGIPLIESPAKSAVGDVLPAFDVSRRALMLYTSGTTKQPKGVVTTHQNIQAQIATLVDAWMWNETDQILCVLPLHHVHGLINVVSCSLWSGACCEFLPSFDAERVFEIFLQGKVNVFMAVPTIYYKLIAHYDKLSAARKAEISNALKKFRLMVSGSAALPVSVMNRWHEVSGHRLLERYGMTELGMAISNPYDGERRAGCVGQPLPGVTIRLCDEEGKLVKNESGEIQVKGANVFLEYWNKPDETKSAFTDDGWFKTGDVAILEDGYYRILGRSSVDIIKSGGYKISALEVEEVLRQHTEIQDCSVVGVEDEAWGEVVSAAIVTKGEVKIDTTKLSLWLKDRLPAYRIPRRFLFLKELPRNAMGKVVKPEVKKYFL